MYKVNRCLARYSPRATTTNQMSRQGLAQKEQKCHFRAKLGLFWAKNPFFYWRNQKFCYPHNRKPTEAPCSYCFLVRHWTKCSKNGNIWPKMTKNADFGPNLAVFGPKIQFFGGKDPLYPCIGIPMRHLFHAENI